MSRCVRRILYHLLVSSWHFKIANRDNVTLNNYMIMYGVDPVSRKKISSLLVLILSQTVSKHTVVMLQFTMLKIQRSSTKSNQLSCSLDNNGNVKDEVKKQPKVKHRGKRGSKKPKTYPKGVVYICHVPHGFYEEQIKAYFSQFGKVTGVNVPRSKTGRAKGYAFIEYYHPEIARIAADTMNNYLMMNRLLKAKCIPHNEQRPRLFQRAKEAHDNQQTLAKRTELAVKHNRKVKNRHLKMSVEVSVTKKLLQKKKSMTKRMVNLGLCPYFEVEEANHQSVLRKQKKTKTIKKE
ncbi:uncharacterized protein LOC129003858 [Macrosteles quadrilineatus]|uniref:uncharacterized protein LOC129003858 n=1 Tax=Macrosteles quadrilineatus TaxID=74068 RepID=UPI0023E1448A|nr:uncharacterized protein LOC129003858 [Macrosteles quadrilineatus]